MQKAPGVKHTCTRPQPSHQFGVTPKAECGQFRIPRGKSKLASAQQENYKSNPNVVSLACGRPKLTPGQKSMQVTSRLGWLKRDGLNASDDIASMPHTNTSPVFTSGVGWGTGTCFGGVKVSAGGDGAD